MSDGEVAQVARQLGPKTTISNLFDKTDSIHSMVEVRERVLAQFYSAHQQEDVTVSDWSHQLEDLLTVAVELGQVNPIETDEMLSRCMFWTRLKKELKAVSGHKFDSISKFGEFVSGHLPD